MGRNERAAGLIARPAETPRAGRLWRRCEGRLLVWVPQGFQGVNRRATWTPTSAASRCITSGESRIFWSLFDARLHPGLIKQTTQRIDRSSNFLERQLIVRLVTGLFPPGSRPPRGITCDLLSVSHETTQNSANYRAFRASSNSLLDEYLGSSLTAPTRNLCEEIGVRGLGLDADASPDTTDRPSNPAKPFRAIRPLFLCFSSESFRVSARACEDQFEWSAGKFFQSTQNIP